MSGKLCGICRHADHLRGTCVRGCLCPSLHPTAIMRMDPELRAAFYGWLVIVLAITIVGLSILGAAATFAVFVYLVGILFGPIGLVGAAYVTLPAILPIIAISILMLRGLEITKELWRSRVSAA